MGVQAVHHDDKSLDDVYSAIIEFRLEAGQLMALDGQRILHGRSGCDHGWRHLHGCYTDNDSIHSRIRVLDAV